ncbi:sensor histidine kinase [Rubrivirga sp.]|uniref:sensor histidine kinase n=1 Tax=Rubrivirga sp. TaxID=1885344 RepID=UPI003B51F8EB
MTAPPPATSPPRPRLTWRGVAAFAAAYAALALLYTVAIEWGEWADGWGVFVAEVTELYPRSLLDYGIKAALTLPVWWVVVRALDGRPRAQAVAHAVLGPLWVWAWFAIYRGLAPVVGYWVLPGNAEVWDLYIPALVYLAQFGALHAARIVAEVRRHAHAEVALRARQAELERTAREAQLAALRAQMDPHFLFNTLNTVAASVPPEQGATRDLVARLAGLVRYTLAAARRDRVLLREELDFVRDYLALEQERMGDRLAVEIDVDADALDVLVPPMLVQPLVENAVRHGLAPTLDGGTVRVEVRRRGDTVWVLVRDDGAGPSRPLVDLLHTGAEGVGLANTDARLRALFGDGLALDTPGSGDGQARGFEARFTVPVEA